MLSRFSPPTVEVIAGLGATGALPDELARRDLRALAVVCDEGVAAAGVLDRLVEGLPVTTCALVRPDPSVADVEVAARDARDAAVDGVLAIGGGSGLGAGKAVALRLGADGPLTEHPARAPGVPTIAIPTTAGSGSEVSDVIVLRDPGREARIALRGAGFAPAVALLDGELLRSLPRGPLIAAALDALSHALEALLAPGANRFTDALALAAGRAIHRSLPRAIDGRPEAWQELLEASAMANLACGSTGLGLVHALSLTTAVALPHGYVNGVLLPWVAEHSRPAARPDVVAELDALGPLYERIGFTPRFAAGEIDGAAARSMIDVALASPLAANAARPADAAALRRMLRQAGATGVDDEADP